LSSPFQDVLPGGHYEPKLIPSLNIALAGQVDTPPSWYPVHEAPSSKKAAHLAKNRAYLQDNQYHC